MRQHTIKTPYIVGEVHCYSTEINGELVLFDSGPPTEEAFDSLKSQLDLSRLKYLFITHCHIDHYGLVSRITEESGARVFFPRNEAIRLRRREECLEHLVNLLSNLGCNGQITGYIQEKTEREYQTVNIPDQYEIVEESDVPAKLGIEWLSCPGHSQSDLVYIHGKHAVTGDILLRNIFQVPILDVDTTTFAGRFRNYDAYCESIMSLRRLRGYRIHPGHRWHVENVDATILFYVRKMLERAAQVQKHADTDSIMDIIRALFGDILKNPFFVHMKISEIVFILDFLANPGQLKSSLESLGLFAAISEVYHSVVRETCSGTHLINCAFR
jgi:hydroxyacylglutathione hydrolase